MAYKLTAICDRCKTQVTQEGKYFENSNSDIKFHEVHLELPSCYNQKTYLFCEKCCEELGVLELGWVSDKKEFGDAKTVADKLMECINEIVAQQIQG